MPTMKTQEKNFMRRMVEQMRVRETSIVSNTEKKQSSVVTGKNVKHK